MQTEVPPEEIAAALTAALRTPTGTMELRPLQGTILYEAEAANMPGLFTNLSVGEGKSLPCALLMTTIGGARPLVFTEASNVFQLGRDIERFRLHWRLPTYYTIRSYDSLSNNPELIDEINPTAVILDEGHKLKAIDLSARARRFDRWRSANPRVPVANLSGTPGRDFGTYAHVLVWCLPQLTIPNGGRIPVDEDGRPRGPTFRDWCEELDANEDAHAEFWTWLRAQPGVVISNKTYTETPLHISHIVTPTPPEMVPYWTDLRGAGAAPDGWLLDGPGEQWQLSRCFANGMYYEHDPRPPQDYLEARKDWIRYQRDILAWSGAPGGPYDTEGTVKRAVIAGRLPDGAAVLRRWQEIEPTYRPVTTTRWLSRARLEWVAEWGERAARDADRRSGGVIIWTDVVGGIGVGEELSRMTGWPYYGSGARNARRQHVSLADRPGTPPVIICSAKSCATGKNLQHRFNQMLFMNAPSNNDDAEQRLGRSHRSDQLREVVRATMLYGCLEDWCGYKKAEREASTAQRDLTAPRKILLAHHERCGQDSMDGPAWQRESAVVVREI